jgi:hypothetical protein
MYSETQNARLDQVVIAEPGTTDWLWSHEKYLRWSERRSGILWIEGKPGSGKSVLAKSILGKLSEDEHQKQSWLIGHWFYSTRGGPALMAHSSFLVAVLRQLLQQDRNLFSFFETYYRRYPPSSKHWWSSNADLISVFKDIAVNGVSVTCIVDAMDESQDGSDNDHRREAILSGLSALVADVEKSRIKLIILSRPFLDIAWIFSQHQHRYGNVHRLLLEAENEAAIEKIIDNGMQSLQNAMHRFEIGVENNVSRTSGSQQGLIRSSQRHRTILTHTQKGANSDLGPIPKYILENAQGVVLWVKLIITVLETHIKRGLFTLPELEEKLVSLPLGVDTIYRHIAEDLRSKFGDDGLEKTRTTLMWISGANSIRPLTLEELREGLAVPKDCEKALRSACDPIEANKIRCMHWTSFVRQLRERCGPFVDVIRLDSHETKSDLLKESVNTKEYADEEAGPRGTDIVQLLHRTAKDFFATPEAAGPLTFNDADAAQFVRQATIDYIKLSFPSSQTGYAPLPVKHNSKWVNNIEKAVAYIDDRRLLPFITAMLQDSQQLSLFGLYASLLDNMTDPPLDEALAAIFLSNDRLDHERFLPLRLRYGDLHDARSIIAGEYIYRACSQGMTVAVHFLVAMLKLTLNWCDMPVEAMIHAYCLVAVENGCTSFALEAPSIFFPPIREVDTETLNHATERLKPSFLHSLYGRSETERVVPLRISSLEAAAIRTGNVKLVTLLYCTRYRAPLRGQTPYIGRGKGMYNLRPGDLRVLGRSHRRSFEPSPHGRRLLQSNINTSSSSRSETRASSVRMQPSFLNQENDSDQTSYKIYPRLQHPSRRTANGLLPLVYGIPSNPQDRFSRSTYDLLVEKTQKHADTSRCGQEGTEAVSESLKIASWFCVQWWRHWGYSAASPRVNVYKSVLQQQDYESDSESDDEYDAFNSFLTMKKVKEVFQKQR